MDILFLGIVVFLFLLAVVDLSVGGSNDAVNFLSSAVGSKAASFKRIVFVAAIGVFIGAAMSNGMMDIARHGIFRPENLSFYDVIVIFMAVMVTDVILLDVFNSLGMPTSTTVSMVFELLGATFVVALFKTAAPESTLSMGDLLNTEKALSVILGIFLSVAIAFVFGSLVQFITRLIFTFEYKSKLKWKVALFGGVACTAIIYFMLIKGIKDLTVMTPELKAWISANTALILGACLVVFTVIMQLLHWMKVNVFKVVVLLGTFSLAMAFAGNDLVNFIGIPLTSLASYQDYMASGGGNLHGFSMESLNGPANTPFYFLIGAGMIMVVSLATSRKARQVTQTTVGLSAQSQGDEMFGSSRIGRSLVRVSLNAFNWASDHTPAGVKRWVARRMDATNPQPEEGAAFDLVRGSVNLMLAGILIAWGTSMKLPLSTTFVTFMVAMGTSLADRAWGRETAVYRISGVMTVVAGWFVTALGGFIIAYVVGLALVYGGTVMLILLTVLAGYMLVHSNFIKKTKSAETTTAVTNENVVEEIATVVSSTINTATRIYDRTLLAVFKENRKVLRDLNRESSELYERMHERKYRMMSTLRMLRESDLDTAQYYVQVVDYLNELTKALTHIVRPAYGHIDNNHEGMTREQIEDLMKINDEVETIFTRINVMLRNNDFADIDLILELRDELFESIADAIKRQLKRIKNKQSSTKASPLYLTILNETKTMVLQARNLVKSQRYFLEHKTE